MSFEGDLFYAIHLMIAGRIKWLPAAAKAPKRPGGRIGLATFEFESGMLVLTEAGTRKRASLEVLRGRDAVRALDRGGIEPLESTVQQFAERFRGERHTLKRSLTDPRLFSGIGNAYSDEILHRARLSPLRQTHQITDAEVKRLHRRYADNETNYCAKCQTGGRLLADRGMSRLLRGDRPKTLEELEGA
jgi:formamidopyrimidine-DNA glycosylase